MAYFVMESFMNGKSFAPEEMQMLVAGHRAFVQAGIDDGTILFTGTKTDGSGSIAVLRAADLAAADAFFDDDPFRTHDIQRNTFRELKINFFTPGVAQWLDCASEQ